MAFDADLEGHSVRVDASIKSGGDASAPNPKQLVLAGLAGCTAVDVVFILGKMRLPIASFEIEAEANQTEGQPAVFDEIKLIYRLSGPELTARKVREAVELSQTKYCGVSAMIFRSGARIGYEIFLNGDSIGTGVARF